MFRNVPRVVYSKNQIVNVVCQLRFPTILSISAKQPDEFQDAIRHAFPRYETRRERPAPKLTNRNGVVTAEKQEEILNHCFTAASGAWQINLTNSFIALSAPQYTDWETFARQLDWVVAEFSRVYQPAWFERVGLRYINAFSKEELGLQDRRWSELLQPAFVGLMDEEDVQDGDFLRCTQDAELKARGGCRVKLHAGPGMIRRKGTQEQSPRFILDLDVYMQGQIPPAHLTGALQTVHLNADNVFRNAITDELHDAMEPR